MYLYHYKPLFVLREKDQFFHHLQIGQVFGKLTSRYCITWL